MVMRNSELAVGHGQYVGVSVEVVFVANVNSNGLKYAYGKESQVPDQSLYDLLEGNFKEEKSPPLLSICQADSDIRMMLHAIIKPIRTCIRNQVAKHLANMRYGSSNMLDSLLGEIQE